MPAMTDPHDAMVSFQQAVRGGHLDLRRGELDPTLVVHADQPRGVFRLSYAHVEGREVTAFATFVQSDQFEGLPCFQAGYAVPHQHRNQGRAKAVLRAAIAEMKNGFARTPIRTFYVEAVVGRDNLASQRVAATVISPASKEIVDEVSGQQAVYYVAKVDSAG